MTRILMICIIYMVIGCNDSNTNDTAPPSSAHTQPSNIVVLCDVSNSISLKDAKDTTKRYRFIQRISSYCKLIPASYPPGSTFKFYIISSNMYGAELGTISLKEKVMKNEIYAVQKKLESDIKIIGHAIDSAARNPEPNTCILSSVESAYKQLKLLKENDKTGLKKNQLIILSDMIEECDDSPVGKIKMRKGKEFLSKQEYVRLQNYHPAIDFDSQGIEINIYMNSPGLAATLNNKIDSTWRLIFSKIGYMRALDPGYTLLKTM